MVNSATELEMLLLPELCRDEQDPYKPDLGVYTQRSLPYCTNFRSFA